MTKSARDQFTVNQEVRILPDKALPSYQGRTGIVRGFSAIDPEWVRVQIDGNKGVSTFHQSRLEPVEDDQ